MNINSDIARGAPWVRFAVLVLGLMGCLDLLIMAAVGWYWVTGIAAPIAIWLSAKYLRSTRGTA